ncbi:MAG: C40 family peptidase, partial [Bacteroidales bacterium]|nr:C40 family peptidase [Bacteroidales bacterium]
LPRDASRQIKCGVPVEFADMQAGDLVFFGEKRASHVAICTGPGRIIHSSQIVRENSLIAGEPDYYGRNILGIRRIIGNLQEKDLVKNSPLYF